MLNEYGVETCGEKFNDCYKEVIELCGHLSKDRDKALEMLNDLQKNDPKTFKLTMLIYSLFYGYLESPDHVIDPACIATLLLRSKL